MTTDNRPSLTRNFAVFWQGRLVSLAGTLAFRMGVAVWLADAVNSASLVGLLMATFIIPGLVLGPFGGVLADRYPRRQLLIACDLIQGSAVLVLALVWAMAPDSSSWLVGALFVLAMIVGSTTAVAQPAVMAFVPEVVATESLGRANSTIQGSVQLVTVAAQSAGAIAFRLLGGPLLAFLNAASYFYAAGSAYFVRTAVAPPPAVRRAGSVDSGLGLRAALTYMRSTPGMLPLVGLMAALKFFMAPFAVLLVFYVAEDLNASIDWYGYLVGGMAIGGIVGVILAGVWKLTPDNGAQAVLAALLAQAVALVALAQVTSPVAALLLLMFAGVAGGFVNVRVATLLQTVVAGPLRGRVFGVLRTATESLLPAGTILAGVVADATGRNIPAIFGGCGAALLVVSLATASSRSCRMFLRGAPQAPRTIEPPLAADVRA
jgi:MFS family permease